MMKYVVRTLISSLLLSTAVSTEIQADIDPFGQKTSTNTENLAKYLLNLGTFLGFDLTQTPKDINPSQKLLDINTTQAAQVSLYVSLFGAVPVNTINPPLMQFVPTNGNSSYIALNTFANNTFKTPPYNTDSSQQQGALSANPLVDQPKFQLDPISQGVLNILTTPNNTYCMNNEETEWKKEGCGKLLYDNLVTNNVIGTIPGPTDFFTYDYNQQFLSQLNSNTLLSPLLYTTSNGSSTSTSSSPKPQSEGLAADSQVQQAANFIRYATGTIIPATLPKYQEYSNLFSKATNLNNKTPLLEQKSAQATLTNYFGKLRVYAAQMSVGFSNLYYILSKRMPQNLPGDQVTSQALSEFTMATWRLFKPDSDQKTANVQWLEQINNASSATIQKEMVTLLAEINYQLYLNRQQEERLLLTETLMLMQNVRTSQPSGVPLSSSAPMNQ
jgi:intracellular multiplication protein IcmX